MAHSYTPGLRVTAEAKIRRSRILPLKGEVCVSLGDRVSHSDVVASTDLPGDVRIVNAVNKLGVDPADLTSLLIKHEGDSVEEGEIIAETNPFISWFKQRLTSPISGTIESISSVTGQIFLRGKPRPVEVTAYIDGEVVEVIENEGVVVETEGAFIQGIFGVGGEAAGNLVCAVDDPGDDLDPDRITDSMAGKLIVGGAMASNAAIQKAISVGASGLITGGMHDNDLKQLLGYDLGVAITGGEDIGTTIVVTEGFGRIAMARATFDILHGCCGLEIGSINGATQIRAGVLRPEIIVPTEEATGKAIEQVVVGLDLGGRIRIIREPYFGRLGNVIDLPSELTSVESETRVRVLGVKFDDGETAVVPRANVESVVS